MPRVYFTVVISGTAWVSLALLLFFIYQENRDLLRNAGHRSGLSDMLRSNGLHGNSRGNFENHPNRIHGHFDGDGSLDGGLNLERIDRRAEEDIIVVGRDGGGEGGGGELGGEGEGEIGRERIGTDGDGHNGIFGRWFGGGGGDGAEKGGKVGDGGGGYGRGGKGGKGGVGGGDIHTQDDDDTRDQRGEYIGDGRGGGGGDSLDPILGRLDANIPRYGPGEGGQAVMLSGDALEKAKRTHHLHNFNLVVSDKISVERSLPDSRDIRCQDITYKFSKFPSASVIIAFHNEAWSTLMRTVHSVVNRTPPNILSEVLLVDDGSTDEELLKKLQHIPALVRPKVRVVHLEQRAGVVRARSRGAKEAIGKVLVFLDSHCEVNVHWLEPLLEIVQQSPTTVVSPIIDIIDQETFAYDAGALGRTTFSWSLETRWVPVSKAEVAERRNPLEPVRSPLTSGGIFAVEKKLFTLVGGLDEGLIDIGEENIDFSFKSWMCGGEVYVVPCSRVGRVTQTSPPNSTKELIESSHHRNLARIAETWMNGSKEEFYRAVPQAKDRYIGDIAKTREIQARLKCHTFDWYLSHVVPLLLATTSGVRTAWGQIRNENHNHLCITAPKGGEGKRVTVEKCDDANDRQKFSLTKRNEIRSGEFCVDLSDYRIAQRITLEQCHGMEGTQEWIHEKPGQLTHYESGFCLDVAIGRVYQTELITNQCSASTNQRWEFTHYTKNHDKSRKISTFL